MRYKLFILLLVSIFLVGSASAFLWNDGSIVSYWSFDSDYTSTVGGYDNVSSSGTVHLLGSGIIGSYANFSNSGYLQYLSSRWISASNFSYNFWVKKTSGPAGFITLNTTTPLMTFYQENSSPTSERLRLYVYDASDNQVVIDATGAGDAISNSSWHMVSVVRNNTSFNLYLDGVLNYSSASSVLLDSGNYFLYLARGSGGEILSGGLDEFGIWNRSLTGTDINELWNNGAGLPFGGNTTVGTVTLTLLNPPTGSTVLSSNTINFTINSSGSSAPSNYNLTNGTYYLFNGSGIYNQTFVAINRPLGITNTLRISNITSNFYNWNFFGCYGNNTFNNCSLATNGNFTFTSQSFSILGQEFNSTVYETSYQSFRINISTVSSVLAVTPSLIYNGTTYRASALCGSGFCTINRSIDVPLSSLNPSENKTFFWNIRVFDGTSTIESNTTSQGQTVIMINVSTCVVGNQSANMSLNFTAYDEQNLTRVSPFNFEATFGSWLGTGTTYRNFTFNQPSVSESDICIYPNNDTMQTNADVLYGDTGSGYYNARNYYLRNASISNTSQSVPLYLLTATDATSFILQVLDSNSLPISDVYIYVNRYYPGNNTLSTVQIARTDNNGKTVAFLQTETVEYQFLLVKNGQVLLLTDKRKVFPESSPFTLTFKVGQGVPNLLSTYNNVSNLQYLFSFNRTTNLLTYTYIDTTGLAHYGRLQVDKQNPSTGFQTICNQTVFQSSASITCDLSAYNGTFIARGYLSRSPEVLVGLYNFVTEIAQAIFSLSGLILGFIIILAVALATIYNPIVQIIAVNFTIITLSIIGILSFSPIAIFGILAVSAIVIILLRV